jgi:anthranilate phosphoribosyltransferase
LKNLSPVWFAEAMALLTTGRDLSDTLMSQAMVELLAGGFGDVEAAAFLVALRTKGESAAEIATAACVLRRSMVHLDMGRSDLVDTCGTGGDDTGTFNISTAAAIVTAAAGVPVVKHGNRAVSSRSGSSDVLAALGVTPLEEGAAIRRCLDETGLAFCFAPHFHPALRHLAAVRKRLQVRTILNCLGPLANPAGAAHQLLGVSRPELLDPMAGALCRLGTRRSFLVCGEGGMDEVSLHGPTQVREVRAESVSLHTWTPEDFELPQCKLSDLCVANPHESAAVIQQVLAGDEGPAACVVLANSAAALLAAERVGSLAEGVVRSREAIHSGRAASLLGRFIACSQSSAPADRVLG